MKAKRPLRVTPEMKERAFHALIDAASLVRLKREKNRLKWGEQNWPDGTGPTTERIARRAAAQARVDAGMKAGTVTYRDILAEEVFEVDCEEAPELVLAELVDVASVAMDWIDSILCRTAKGKAK